MTTYQIQICTDDDDDDDDSDDDEDDDDCLYYLKWSGLFIRNNKPKKVSGVKNSMGMSRLITVYTLKLDNS